MPTPEERKILGQAANEADYPTLIYILKPFFPFRRYGL